MKPIAIVFGDCRTVVISPLSAQSHTAGSWSLMREKISTACVAVIDDTGTLTVEKALAMVKDHSEWKCTAVEAISIEAINLVE